MNMKKAAVLAGIGELLWDILPEGRRLGGASANFAYHAKQQGAQSYVVSACGNDVDGHDLLAELKRKSLSTEYISVHAEYPTGTVSVELKNGHPSYTIHQPVAWDFIEWNEKIEALAKTCDGVCFGSLAQRNKRSRSTIQAFLKALKADCLKIFDINLRQDFYTVESLEYSLQNCDILKISDEELPTAAKALDFAPEFNAVEDLRKRYNLKAVVLTMGAAGSSYYDRSGVISVPAFDYGVKVDSVGCGDSFTASLVTALLKGFSPDKAMRHATKIAGLVCASAGAMPDIPEELKLT